LTNFVCLYILNPTESLVDLPPIISAVAFSWGMCCPEKDAGFSDAQNHAQREKVP
jgi:hypothetical protein